jgi:hypothetical protein
MPRKHEPSQWKALYTRRLDSTSPASKAMTSACTDPITRLEIAHDSVFHQDVFDLFVGGDVEASSQTRYVESDHVCRIVFEWVGLVIHRLNGRVFSTNQTPGATKNFMVF